MKSSEQMGGLPEQSKEEIMEENERKATTPEKAAEMTRQRRKEYGLEESGDITPEKVKEIDADIEKLLESLYEYDYDGLTPELQEECYWVEQEANVGKDRELAKAVLEKFLNVLKEKIG